MGEGISHILRGVQNGDFMLLARAISMVENDHPTADELLASLMPHEKTPIIGITGPPGSGKSTLLNAITENLVVSGKKVAILAVDPSSPFNHGSLLGDRIRMTKHSNKPGVYIRSIASRGALGGLAEKAIEISDVLRSAIFDVIFVETVGVGQSEIDIVGLADLTVVVLVPESGDEIQHLKSGLMEIADVLVVNKADREGADLLAGSLKRMLKEKKVDLPVVATVANKAEGIEYLIKVLFETHIQTHDKGIELKVNKAWRLIQKQRMKDVDKKELMLRIGGLYGTPNFNIYRYIQQNY